jgi:hypothetical protein
MIASINPSSKGCTALLSVVAGITLTGCMAPRTQAVQVDPAAAAREEQIQRDMRIERQYAQQSRVLNVGYPILKGATAICGEDIRTSTGLMYATTYDFAKDDMAAATRYGVRAEPTVIGTVAGSPASRTGFQRGDVMQTINGSPVPTGKKATAETTRSMMEATSANPSVRVGIKRAGVQQEITVVAETICSYPVVLVQDDMVNAFADGKAIYITSGMLRFVESDQELATVIGHELAHNAMDHMKAKNVNRALGTIFDVVAAAYGVNTQGAFGDAASQAYSQAFEAEADYVGVYALALAGVDTRGTANLWRRMGAEMGGIKTKYGSSHPGSTDRYLAIDSTVAEVNDKIVNMQPLTPNLKKD